MKFKSFSDIFIDTNLTLVISYIRLENVSPKVSVLVSDKCKTIWNGAGSRGIDAFEKLRNINSEPDRIGTNHPSRDRINTLSIERSYAGSHHHICTQVRINVRGPWSLQEPSWVRKGGRGKSRGEKRVKSPLSPCEWMLYICIPLVYYDWCTIQGINREHFRLYKECFLKVVHLADINVVTLNTMH